MSIQWYLWVLLTLLSIIPSLVVATIFIVKIVEIRGGLTRIDIEINALKGDKAKSADVLSSFDSRLTQVFADSNQANTRYINLEESFRALSNKWNSRERELKKEDRLREKEAEKVMEVDEPDDGGSGDPRFPQLNMFPPAKPPVMSSRKFGQLPRQG